ncbi:hypothetical protein ACTA71_007584 [Dictyostelium dimigraforme]
MEYTLWGPLYEITIYGLINGEWLHTVLQPKFQVSSGVTTQNPSSVPPSVAIQFPSNLRLIGQLSITDTEDYKDISNFMKEICYDKSVILIKNENGVSIFCDFIDHILDHDYDKVLSLYHKANKNFKPLELAIVDTIQERFYKKEERSHQLVDSFLRNLNLMTNQYLKSLKKRDEL